jgi:transposase
MARCRPTDAKANALRESGTLNPRAERVGEPLFAQEEFFDARDLLQVKYEMLRQVDVQGVSVSAAAATFGFSRVAFYQARQRFEQEGVAGLLPRPRGPKRAHKLSEDVVRFLERALAEDPSLRAPVLARWVEERFGVSVHPRSIERALARPRKKGRQ